MPVHDWTRADAGLFHDFHQSWTIALLNALNSGGLPPDYFALIEKILREPHRDFFTLDLTPEINEPRIGMMALAASTAFPPAYVVKRTEADLYVARANRITVRNKHGDVVAVIEIVSPGNKGSRSEFRAFVQKSVDLISQGIHLLVIDLFPTGPRDPQGIAKAIWDEFKEEDFERPPDKPLTLASFDAGPVRVAYVDFVAVGDSLPDMALFLEPELYVPTPLEATYQATWNVFPAPLKGLLEPAAANRSGNP